LIDRPVMATPPSHLNCVRRQESFREKGIPMEWRGRIRVSVFPENARHYLLLLLLALIGNDF